MEVFFRLDTICSGRDVALIGSSQHTMGSNNFVHISMDLFVHESLRNIKAIILQTDVCENSGPLIVNQWLWVLIRSLSSPCLVLVWSLSGPCPDLVLDESNYLINSWGTIGN